MSNMTTEQARNIVQSYDEARKLLQDERAQQAAEYRADMFRMAEESIEFNKKLFRMLKKKFGDALIDQAAENRKKYGGATCIYTGKPMIEPCIKLPDEYSSSYAYFLTVNHQHGHIRFAVAKKNRSFTAVFYRKDDKPMEEVQEVLEYLKEVKKLSNKKDKLRKTYNKARREMDRLDKTILQDFHDKFPFPE